MSVTRLSSLCEHLNSTQFGNTVALCLSPRAVARISRLTTGTISFLVASFTTGRAFATSPCGARGEEMIRTVLSSSKKRADILYHLN